MSCQTWEDRLLELDSREIAESLAATAGQGRLADDQGCETLENHLGSCAGCRALAKRVVASEAELSQGLRILGPRRPLAASVASAIEDSNRRAVHMRRSSWAVAAAGVAAVLALRAFHAGNGVVPEPAVVAERPAVRAFTPEVEALLDESVLVLETDNDDVVVFWFYQGRGE